LPLTLKDLTFSLKAGEKIGIVGRTGAGKSSLVSCLFRLVPAASGKILLDGVDIANVSLVSFRKTLSFELIGSFCPKDRLEILAKGSEYHSSRPHLIFWNPPVQPRSFERTPRRTALARSLSSQSQRPCEPARKQTRLGSSRERSKPEPRTGFKLQNKNNLKYLTPFSPKK